MSKNKNKIHKNNKYILVIVNKMRAASWSPLIYIFLNHL